MGLLQDFENSKVSTKSMVLYFAIITPMFYVSIYLFKPSMIHIVQGNPLVNMHFYFLISVCLILSILWFGMIFFVTERAISLVKKKVLEEEIKKIESSIVKSKRLVNSDLSDQKKEFFNRTFERIKNTRINREKIKINKIIDSEFQYRLTLFYSVAYFACSVGLNHFFVHLSLPIFLLSNLLFIFIRLIFVSMANYSRQEI